MCIGSSIKVYRLMQNFILFNLIPNSHLHKHICDPYPHHECVLKSRYLDLQMGLGDPCGGIFELFNTFYLKEDAFKHLELPLEFCHHGGGMGTPPSY